MSSTLPVSALAGGVRGALITPEDPSYDDARATYNAMIDRRPAAVLRCADVADVIAGVDHARAAGLPLAIRGGGHNVAGFGSVDDGLVLDLGDMDGVRVDAEAHTVRVEGGATIGEMDHATHGFGLAVPTGVLSTTGVGGLTLGGGLGYLSRRFGLTIDNLLEADVVLADGRQVTASQESHPDLFWALRGGGGNFGVVTSFLFRAYPVDTVVGGPMLFDVDDSVDVLRVYRDVMASAPWELSGFFAFLTVPPVDAFPAELHLRKMAGIVWCWTGDPARADDALAAVRALGPVLDGVGEVPFPALQSAFDALYPKGHQHYWRADFVRDLSEDAIAAHAAQGPTLPTMQASMHLYPIDGAVARVPAGDTAWAHRDARFAEVIFAVDPDPARAAELRDWTIGYWEALHPYAADGAAYVNFMMEEGADRVRASYGQNFDRLRRVKAEYDPANLFHVNQNIPPAT